MIHFFCILFPPGSLICLKQAFSARSCVLTFVNVDMLDPTSFEGLAVFSIDLGSEKVMNAWRGSVVLENKCNFAAAAGVKESQASSQTSPKTSRRTIAAF